MTRSLIVGMDDTDGSRNALARAAELARAADLRLVVVHVRHIPALAEMSHDLSLHVNNTVGLTRTAGVFGIPLVLTNGADTGPYGPLFSELRAVTGSAPQAAHTVELLVQPICSPSLA